MSFDATFALDTILPLAEAAYNLEMLPPDWKLVAAIQPDSFGFLAQRDDTVVVSFRGTEHEKEWLRDFDARPVPNDYGPGCVHRGFQNQYAMVRSSLFAALHSRAYNTLWISGHSLGGPLALQFASELTRPSVWTFEAPRAGWFDWAHWYDQIIPVTWRIENKWDVVPHIPHEFAGFRSVGTLVAIDGGYTSDGHVAHSLALSVGPGLQKLVAASA